MSDHLRRRDARIRSWAGAGDNLYFRGTRGFIAIKKALVILPHGGAS